MTYLKFFHKIILCLCSLEIYILPDICTVQTNQGTKLYQLPPSGTSWKQQGGLSWCPNASYALLCQDQHSIQTVVPLGYNVTVLCVYPSSCMLGSVGSDRFL